MGGFKPINCLRYLYFFEKIEKPCNCTIICKFPPLKLIHNNKICFKYTRNQNIVKDLYDKQLD